MFDRGGTLVGNGGYPDFGGTYTVEWSDTSENESFGPKTKRKESSTK